MNVSLTPELEKMVRDKVASGLYNNASEVVREALRLMVERERLNRLRAAIAIGDEAVARGEVTIWTEHTMSEMLDEIDREVDERLSRGEEPDPDVCP